VAPTDRPRPWRRSALWLALIVAAQVLAGLLQIAAVPLWQQHEADYYNIVQTLAQQGRLPSSEGLSEAEADVLQLTQPPLYFAVGALVAAAFPAQQPMPPGEQLPTLCIGEIAQSPLLKYPSAPGLEAEWRAGFALRLLSLAFGVSAVVLAWAAGRVLAPRWPLAALLGAALVAFEPNTLALATTISNDALLMLLACANLYAALRLFREARWRWAVLMLLTAALAVLTRLPGWATAAFTGLCLLAALGHALLAALRQRMGRRLLPPLMALAGGAAALAAIMLFNLSAYGTVFGRYAGLEDSVSAVFTRLNALPETAIAVFRATAYDLGSVLTSALPDVLAFAVLLALAAGLSLGGLCALLALRRRPTVCTKLLWLPIACLGVGVGLVLLRNTMTTAFSGGVTSYLGAAIFAPVRYYAPALPALALLCGWGLAMAVYAVHVPARAVRAARTAGTLAAAGVALCLLAAGLISSVRALRERPAPVILSASAFDALEGVTRLQPALQQGFPHILGYRTELASQRSMVSLTLFAQIDAPLLTHQALRFALGDQTCTVLPGRGFDSTLAWAPGNIHALTVDVPNCNAAPPPELPLSVSWIAADLNGTVQGRSQDVSLGVQSIDGVSASCPPDLGTIGARYRLWGFDTPAEVAREENYQPSARWIVEQRDAAAQTRRFIFRQQQGSAEYMCEFADRPVSIWEEGEIVYVDRCPLRFPAQAPPGLYDASVVLLDANGQPLPAQDAAGQPLQDGRVPLGVIVVR
jgi:hypothetical protein